MGNQLQSKKKGSYSDYSRDTFFEENETCRAVTTVLGGYLLFMVSKKLSVSTNKTISHEQSFLASSPTATLHASRHGPRHGKCRAVGQGYHVRHIVAP